MRYCWCGIEALAKQRAPSPVDDFSLLNTSRPWILYKSISPAAPAIAYNSEAPNKKEPAPLCEREAEPKKALASQNAWRYVLNIYTAAAAHWAAQIFFLPCTRAIIHKLWAEKMRCAQPQRDGGGNKLWSFNFVYKSITTISALVQSCFFYARETFTQFKREKSCWIFWAQGR